MILVYIYMYVYMRYCITHLLLGMYLNILKLLLHKQILECVDLLPLTLHDLEDGVQSCLPLDDRVGLVEFLLHAIELQPQPQVLLPQRS